MPATGIIEISAQDLPLEEEIKRLKILLYASLGFNKYIDKVDIKDVNGGLTTLPVIPIMNEDVSSPLQVERLSFSEPVRYVEADIQNIDTTFSVKALDQPTVTAEVIWAPFTSNSLNSMFTDPHQGKMYLCFICRHWRPRSECEHAKSDQGFHCSLTDSFDTIESVAKSIL